ncbi:MAG: aminotransferase class I/II-fold pyridoxal phosphate-dependent enzyme [Firmicutes bacterium]|nr:aminotransferase class I/II-fold pyridoxal phosphate-dependent enzyme [Bacillota bacterium]
MKTVKTPIPSGAMGWSVVGQEEIAAVTALLSEPQNLFRVRDDGKPSECAKLEQAIREKTGAAHALFVASGTGALSCCLTGFEIGPGDEVIIPAYTFIATAAAVVDVGAVPVIAEIDDSLGIDPVDLEKKITPYTKAVIVVNMVGVPARLDAIRAVCKKHNLILIEDNCQAIGATYKGKFCGVESDAFAWSTNFFKVITCGEGGVFATNSPKAFQRGVYQSDNGLNDVGQGHPQNKAIKPFSRSGIRGNEIAAAVLNVQLSKMDGMLSHTRALKKRLFAQLNAPVNYKPQHVDDPDGDCGFCVNLIMNDTDKVEKFLELAHEEGLPLTKLYEAKLYEGGDLHIYSNWTPILEKRGATAVGYPWKDPAYKGNVEYSVDMCPNSLDILGRTVRLLFNVNMTETNIDEFAAALNKIDKEL